MEIIDYLRIIRKRIAVLLLVPLLAAGAAAAYILSSPATYSATATVSTGTLVGGTGDFTGPQATSQFVAAFSAAATGPSVINAVSDRTGVSPTDLRAGLLLAQAGASSDMTVTYTSTNKYDVYGVVRSEVTQTLESMFQPRATAAAKQRDAAQAAVNAANSAVAAYAKKVGVADPPSAYQATLNQVYALQQQQATLRANGNAAGAAGLQPLLAAAQARLADFGPILGGYNDVAATQNAAEGDLTTAQTQYRQAQSQLESANASDVTYISEVLPTSRTATLLTLVIPVFGAGILLAFVLVISLEMLRGAKRARVVGAETDSGHEGAGDGVDGAGGERPTEEPTEKLAGESTLAQSAQPSSSEAHDVAGVPAVAEPDDEDDEDDDVVALVAMDSLVDHDDADRPHGTANGNVNGNVNGNGQVADPRGRQPAGVGDSTG